MVLLTSGIVDEWLDPPWSPLSTASALFIQGKAWNLRLSTAARALTHCWAPRDQAADPLRPPGTVFRRKRSAGPVGMHIDSFIVDASIFAASLHQEMSRFRSLSTSSPPRLAIEAVQESDWSL